MLICLCANIEQRNKAVNLLLNNNGGVHCSHEAARDANLVDCLCENGAAQRGCQFAALLRELMHIFS
jgi:hypothetical protein